jgi:exopolysaccharide biosynthesis polyprenyl glycosylphosphotransferase
LVRCKFRRGSLARRTARRSNADRSNGLETLQQEARTERIIVLDDAASGSAVDCRSPYRLLYRWMVGTDILGMVAALLLALQVRFGWHWPAPDFLLVLLAAAAMTLAVYHGFGLYETHQFSSLEEFRRMITAVTLTITAVAMLSFWSEVSSSRLWVVYSWILALGFAAVSRRLWHRQVRRSWVEDKLTFDTLVVGINEEAQHLAELLGSNRVGFRPIGFVSTGSTNGAPPSLPVMGAIDRLRGLIHATGARCVFVAASAVTTADMKHVLKARRLDGVEIRVTANLPPTLATQVAIQSIGGLMALTVNAVRLTRTQAIAKRAFDVVMSAVGLLLLAPAFLVIAVAIKATTPGPVFFRQQRVGLQRRPFTLLKFRTMVADAELRLADLLSRNEADGPLFKLRHDPRITRVGGWLRRYSLDELPQLWNVLRGEMSLVGPRPPLPSEVAAYEDWQLDRLEVRPGITGLWQVSGRSDLSFDEYVRLDLFYIENWSLAYDLYLLGRTVPRLVWPRGRSDGAAAGHARLLVRRTPDPAPHPQAMVGTARSSLGDLREARQRVVARRRAGCLGPQPHHP